MAAPPPAHTVSKTPLLSHYNDNDSTPNGAPRLPNGPCNFTNLTVGGAAPPRCGCQRFWSRSQHVDSPAKEQLDVCMCQHHACFHDYTPARANGSNRWATSSTFRSSSQLSRRGGSAFSSQSWKQLQDHKLSEAIQAKSLSRVCDGGLRSGSGCQSQVDDFRTGDDLPTTGSWAPQAQPEPNASKLPPIPSQCLLPSDISSGGISGSTRSFGSIIGDIKPLFMASGEKPTLRPMGSSRSIYAPLGTAENQVLPTDGQTDSFLQSVTEVITPRSLCSPEPGLESRLEQNIAHIQAAIDVLASGQDGRPCDPLISTEDCNRPGHSISNISAVAMRSSAETNIMETTGGADAPAAAPAPPSILPHLQSILKLVSSHPRLSTRVDNHEQRIDLLENVSTSCIGAQEVYEKIDLVEERIGEVEGRVEELEKSHAAINDLSSVNSFRRCLLPKDSDDSTASQTSSAVISAAIERTELSARLDNLESQLVDLKSLALPSYAHPWMVEVVFLPFGSSLKGIWSRPDQFPSQRSRHNTIAMDNRTQTQHSIFVCGQTLSNNAQPDHRLWENMRVHSEQNRDWLVARACAQRSKVEERLRSRGFVKVIEVKGPEARDVQAAMAGAFGDLPDMLISRGSDLQLPSSLAGFYGLQASWVPLRKLHKDSQLRFLDASEMVTPALWTVPFLSSSVAMRAAGIKRLYITQPASYLQQAVNAAADWTWQKMRILPRVFPDIECSTGVREGDAKESCWQWDERLDPPPSVHSSFTSQHSSLSIRRAASVRSQSSHHSYLSDQSYSAAQTPIISTTPTSINQAIAVSPLIERHRPLHTRTNSMPSTIPLKFSPSQSKRRIASFDHEFQGHSARTPPIRPSASIANKRQRISRSPSRPRDTPRWSAGPPSPYSFDGGIEHKRGNTPFAYATPHSNIPYVDFRPHSVTGMTADDHEDHGSTTDDVELHGDEKGLDFNSDADHGHQLEHEAWEGVGDEMADDDDSDQERKALSFVDNDDDDDDNNDISDMSSGPSEYPSTQPPGYRAGNKGAFHIHVDEDEGRESV